MQCQCESSNCPHALKACQERATVRVHTVYGLFKMCRECAEKMAATKYCRYTEPLDEPAHHGYPAMLSDYPEFWKGA